tara:strand:+ start:449 stop:700 length:252 start_codon:yes stop_codon:yes gene_type:complete
MKLKYKGWFISAYPTKDPDKIHWNILLENNIGENQIQTRSFDVHPAMTLKAVEDLAFDKIDEIENTRANIQRVDAQTKKYWGK